MKWHLNFEDKDVVDMSSCLTFVIQGTLMILHRIYSLLLRFFSLTD